MTFCWRLLYTVLRSYDVLTTFLYVLDTEIYTKVQENVSVLERHNNVEPYLHS